LNLTDILCGAAAGHKYSPYLLALPAKDREDEEKHLMPPKMDPEIVLAKWNAAAAKVEERNPMYQKSFRAYEVH